MITKAAFKTELKSLGIKTYRTQNGKTFSDDKEFDLTFESYVDEIAEIYNKRVRE